MQIDIPAHIEKLLFLHDALIIPGFGGFTATRTPASADYVGGSVAPPAKTLAFSENLTVDDGILVGDIAQTHGIALDDARKAIVDFVEKMQTLLQQREIVTLPGVGRLYRNYVQKIQFLPDSTNFNASSYGLPPLQFSPIARSREVVEKPATEAVAGNASSTNPPVYTPPEIRIRGRGVAAVGRGGDLRLAFFSSFYRCLWVSGTGNKKRNKPCRLNATKQSSPMTIRSAPSHRRLCLTNPGEVRPQNPPPRHRWMKRWKPPANWLPKKQLAGNASSSSRHYAKKTMPTGWLKCSKMTAMKFISWKKTAIRLASGFNTTKSAKFRKRSIF